VRGFELLGTAGFDNGLSFVASYTHSDSEMEGAGVQLDRFLPAQGHGDGAAALGPGFRFFALPPAVIQAGANQHELRPLQRLLQRGEGQPLAHDLEGFIVASQSFQHRGFVIVEVRQALHVFQHDWRVGEMALSRFKVLQGFFVLP